MQSYRWLGCLALTTASCFPLQDLSGYDSSSLAAGSGGTASMDSLGSGGSSGAGAGLAGFAGSAGGAAEGVPGEGTPLVPGGIDDPNGTPTNCSGSLCTGDGGLAGGFDAGSPFPPEPSIDASPPLPGCALDERRGPNGNCYVLAATLLAWPDARVGCQARGSGWDLATIRSAQDSGFLLTLLTGDAWLGGSDSTTEGTWAWVTDGAEFWLGDGETGNALNGAFVNWFTDEPNGEDSSDCLRVLASATWADLECEELRPSVCEGPPE